MGGSSLRIRRADGLEVRLGRSRPPDWLRLLSPEPARASTLLLTRRGVVQAALTHRLFFHGGLLLPLQRPLPAPVILSLCERLRPHSLVVDTFHQASIPAELRARFFEEAPVETPEGPYIRFRARVESTRGPVDGLLIQTSGTTARPRMVHLPRAAVMANVDAVIERLPMLPGAILANIMPLHHMNGIALSLVAAARLDGTLLMLDPFEPETILSGCAAAGADWLSGSPTHLQSILDTAIRNGIALTGSGLRATLTGSAPVPRALFDEWEGATRVPLIEGYGLTEASCRVCLSSVADARPGLAGPPLMGDVEVRSLPGRGAGVGEVHVRGPHLASGYWDDPRGTAERFPDGWLATGDLGRWVDGQLEVLGRTDELMIRHGLNVHPGALYAAGQATTLVRESFAFGLPTNHSAERVIQIICPRQPHTFELADYLHELRQRLPPEHVPDAVLVAPALPRTASGKVDRGAARRLGSALWHG